MKKTILMILIIFATISYGQSGKTKISGTVVDEKNLPLPGVTVLIKGTNLAVSTDIDGLYSIAVGDTNSVLVFSFIGYDNKEVVVGSDVTINIKLIPAENKLEEVVVVGYGTQKKSDVTGSVTTVSKERLSQLPVTNVLQSVQGAVAGVSITQSSSVPGSGVSAVIRGTNSISASTGPFIVLDGMPYSTTGGSINDINPNDIESMEILKDASAVAIYGTRGANGVILITTKKGKKGKPVIKLNAYTGVEQFSNTVNPMGPDEYLQKYADWKTQSGTAGSQILPNLYEQQNYANGITNDWIREISQMGKISNYNVSISGGSEDVKYFISGDLLNQDGVIKGYNYNRASLRSNINAKITPYLNGGVNIFLTNNNSDGGRANLSTAGTISPYGSLYDANGNYEIYPMFGELLYRNPLLGLTTTRNERSQNINANAFFDVIPAFIPGFTYKLNVGYTLVPTQFQSYIGRSAGDLLGTATVSNTETRNYTIENIFNYNKTWNEHSLAITGLYSAAQTDYFSSSTTGTGFINDQLQFNNLSAASSVSATSAAYKSNLLSQMLRANYSYASKYLFTVTARRDGYSAFGANTSKYGMFPSVAFGWNVSKEKFLEDSKVISSLKLRTSYGLSGNQAIDPNVTTTTAANVRLPFNGLSTIGVVANVLGNKNLTWESTLGTNVGVDFELFNKRITGTIDAYSTNTKDLLLYRSVPVISGFVKVLDNLGKVANKGLEVTLKTMVLQKADFKWDVNANFATNQNKIVDLYGDKKDDIGNQWFIGQPVNVVFDFKQTGIWQLGENPAGQDPSAKPGDIKFADTNGDGVITPADRVVLGQSSPKWIGGITNTFHYKDFHLNVFIQTAQGITKNNTIVDYKDFGGRQNLPSGIGYWTSTNGNDSRPSLSYTNSRGYKYPKDASYTRLKDITLSYVATEKLLNKIHLGALTVYASGRNIITWTKWFGWDPEADFDNTIGLTTNSYPLTSTFIIGVNITLK